MRSVYLLGQVELPPSDKLQQTPLDSDELAAIVPRRDGDVEWWYSRKGAAGNRKLRRRAENE